MKAIDLFAGAGGWDLAATALGWDVDGVEIMREAKLTRAAAGLTTIADDVRDVDPTQGEYDAEIASPPCQTFSTAGNGAGRKALDAVRHGIRLYLLGERPTFAQLAALTGDDRTALVLEPLRIALAARPMFVAWEQVPPVLPVWEACADVLRQAGYSVATGNLNAEQYGVPQTRKRAILIARRDGRPAALPAPTHSRYYPRTPDRLDAGVLPWVSMADALGWSASTEVVSNYGTGGDPAARGRRPATAPSATITSKASRSRVVLRSAQSVAGSGRALRSINTPCVTITQTASRCQWVDGNETRRMQLPETATLQTFPPDFPFHGDKSATFLQVGNAVPPLLARHVLAAVCTERSGRLQ